MDTRFLTRFFFFKQEAAAVATVKRDAVTVTTVFAVASIRLHVNVKICPKLRVLDIGFQCLKKQVHYPQCLEH